MGALFALVGASLLPVGLGMIRRVPEGVDVLSRAGFREHGGGLVLSILAAGFALLGGTVLGLALYARLYPVRVRHVPDEEVREVEPRPLLPADADTHSVVTHALEQGRFAPDPTLPKRRLRASILFGAVFWAVVVVLLFTLRPLDALTADEGTSTALHGGLAAFSFVSLAAVITLVSWIQSRRTRSLVSFEFERDPWEVRSAEGEVLGSGLREQLVAVQVVAARHAIAAANRGVHYTDALEANLAWRDEQGEIRRVNLLRSSGRMPALVRLASRLADRLGVPLLFHASEAHWSGVERRARGRRPGRGSIG